MLRQVRPSGRTSRSSTSACRRPTPTKGSSPPTQIRAEHPETGVLLLSHYVEPSYALRLLEEHPERVGYLLKERVFDVAILVDALRRIADGETVVDPTIVARLVGRRRREDPLGELTPREREVLALVAEGLSNRAIATRLFVTERTVEAHIQQIFAKLRLGADPELASPRARGGRLPEQDDMRADPPPRARAGARRMRGQRPTLTSPAARPRRSHCGWPRWRATRRRTPTASGSSRARWRTCPDGSLRVQVVWDGALRVLRRVRRRRRPGGRRAGPERRARHGADPGTCVGPARRDEPPGPSGAFPRRQRGARRQVVTSDLARDMLAGLDKAGVVGIALLPEGLRYPVGFERPMIALGDFAGATMRVAPVRRLVPAVRGARRKAGRSRARRFVAAVVVGADRRAESEFARGGELPRPGAFTANLSRTRRRARSS